VDDAATNAASRNSMPPHNKPIKLQTQTPFPDLSGHGLGFWDTMGASLTLMIAALSTGDPDDMNESLQELWVICVGQAIAIEYLWGLVVDHHEMIVEGLDVGEVFRAFATAAVDDDLVKDTPEFTTR